MSLCLLRVEWRVSNQLDERCKTVRKVCEEYTKEKLKEKLEHKFICLSRLMETFTLPLVVNQSDKHETKDE